MKLTAMKNGATINGKHTYRDYKMLIGNNDVIGSPVPNTYYLDVPHGKKIDLTEIMGVGVTYSNRILKMEFGALKSVHDWNAFLSNLYKDIQGKKVKVIFDIDRSHYFLGRALLSNFNRAQELGTFTMEVDAEPYKYNITTTTENWIFNTFVFKTDKIRYYKDIKITGKTNVKIIGCAMPVIPQISCSSAMSVMFEGKQYHLKFGTNKITDIYIKDKEYILEFTGNGTISIDFRGGEL